MAVAEETIHAMLRTSTRDIVQKYVDAGISLNESMIHAMEIEEAIATSIAESVESISMLKPNHASVRVQIVKPLLRRERRMTG